MAHAGNARATGVLPAIIEEASKGYLDALQHGVLSSPRVVEAAERAGRRIVDTYLEPDKTLVELRDMVNSGSLDIP